MNKMVRRTPQAAGIRGLCPGAAVTSGGRQKKSDYGGKTCTDITRNRLRG